MTINSSDVTTWINQNKGKYIDFNGWYGVQCYDLFNAYGKKFWNITFFNIQLFYENFFWKFSTKYKFSYIT